MGMQTDGQTERQIELLRDYVIKHKNERNLHVGEIDMFV